MTRRDAIVAGVAGLTAAAAVTPGILHAEDAPPANPELDQIRELLLAHDKALTEHDLAGVLALQAEKSALMGTGPGEIWSGPEELEDAYTNFFKSFDKGEQSFEYHFRLGDIGNGMAWLLTSGNVSGKKDGKAFTYPLNVSITVTKDGGKWKIASMHYSTLSAGE